FVLFRSRFYSLLIFPLRPLHPPYTLFPYTTLFRSIFCRRLAVLSHQMRQHFGIGCRLQDAPFLFKMFSDFIGIHNISVMSDSSAAVHRTEHERLHIEIGRASCRERVASTAGEDRVTSKSHSRT